ncbi:MAG TPA: carboxypeptidase regulatory-like domain-containing protein [Bryobacteraceae bacterium]|nr:carboxypeptidase regulatory-like domain-containing protein [Bryobacteraceae bacterium]
MKKIWIGVGLVCAVSLVSCGGGGDTKTAETPKAPDSGAPAAGGSATPDMENGATITGKVTFDGAKPTMKPIDMSANPVCMRAHASSPQKSEEVQVNDNGTLKDAFVWIKSGLPDKTWQVPTTAVTLDQKGCMYSPHVIGVMAGQNIDIKTSDPTNHNIHPQPTVNSEWNESQAPGSEDKMKSFPRQEVMIPVKCNIHPWMRAYIGVVSNPFYAVTGDDGSYTIKGLPPGTYTIEVWHEKFGTQDQTITVGAKDSKTQDFTIKG